MSESASWGSHAGKSASMKGGLHKSGAVSQQRTTSRSQDSLSPSIKKSTAVRALSGSPGLHAAASPRTRPRLTVAQYQSASAEALQAEVQQVQDALCADQTAYSRALEDVQKSTSKIQQLKQQVK
jgi:signal transduction protein with GAF and PtsI domain